MNSLRLLGCIFYKMSLQPAMSLVNIEFFFKSGKEYDMENDAWLKCRI